MAKVTEPNEQFKSYRTVGGTISLRQKGTTYTVSERAHKQSRREASEIFIKENSQAIRDEWQTLTPEEKQNWETLGLAVSQTGYFTFYNMRIKGTTNSRCGVAICGISRCVSGA